MASWRERLQPAKFRDAEFFVESSEGELGRKTVLHSYPQRDTPYPEDMGRKDRQFPMEAYVIGRDYMAARDRLVAALETKGPGALVHPYRGAIQVSLLSARGPIESVREGGMARFSLTFVEAGDNKYPSSTFDTSAIVDARADAALTAAQGDFVDGFSVAGMSDFVASHAQGLVTAGLSALQAASSMLPDLPPGLSAFSGNLDRLGGMTSTLIRKPSSLASELVGLVTGLGSLFARPENALQSYRSLWPFGNNLASQTASTPARAAMVSNQNAFSTLIRVASTIEATRAASQIPFANTVETSAATQATGESPTLSEFDNYPAAISLRDDLAAQLDTEMDTAPDTTYAALADLRTAMVSDINTRGADLAQISYFTPADTQPALVLAYQLYGDATQDQMIVGRNNIVHPGFVPAGSPIEVLNG